jgi:hypothetical protein
MQRLAILLVIIISIICISLGAAAESDSTDVLVWQGQYFTGTTFNTGNYEFNFSVYDALTGGEICYSNTTNLTTGSFGEWKTEQFYVSSSCNNVSKNYYLNININGIDQIPRRRIVVWNFLRKNVHETSNGSIEIDTVKVRIGLKDLNQAVWQSKLDYAEESASTTLISQRDYALKVISTHKEITDATTGENIELKITRLQQIGEQAKELVNSNAKIALAKMLEAKRLALLNGVTSVDMDAIEETARLKEVALNLTAQEQIAIIEGALNNSIAEIEANDDGIRFCLSNGTNCMSSSGNPFNQALNTTSDVTFNNLTTNYGFFSYLGSLASRITKLWIVDIDATGNIETSQNVSANYFKGDGSLLTNLPAGGGETDPKWAANSSTVARTGNCPAGQAVQNTTTAGVQCMTPSAGAESDPKWSANFTNMQTDCPSDNYAYGVNGNGALKCRQDQEGSGSGLTPAYLGSDLNATSANYTTIFTIALTPSKINIIQAYLAQSSPTNGVAIQNRAIISESGPVGNCNFVTQTQAGAERSDNTAVSTNSADTGSTMMGLDTNVPFINTVTCTVLADANQRNLIIQFESETAAAVITYAGSYYTNAVN